MPSKTNVRMWRILVFWLYRQFHVILHIHLDVYIHMCISCWYTSRWWKLMKEYWRLPYYLLPKLAVSPARYLKNSLKLISRYLFKDRFLKINKLLENTWKTWVIRDSAAVHVEADVLCCYCLYMWRKENTFSSYVTVGITKPAVQRK